MERRKFVIGMGALATGSAAAVGTGAFSSVEADRSVSVEVADDAEAYVGLDPENNQNGDYAETSGGELEILLDGTDDTDGDGLNPNSETIIRDIFDIENNGTDDVYVWFEDVPTDKLAIYADDLPDPEGTGQPDTSLDFSDSDSEGGSGAGRDAFGDPEDNEIDEIKVPSGESMGEVGITARKELSNNPENLSLTLRVKAEHDY